MLPFKDMVVGGERFECFGAKNLAHHRRFFRTNFCKLLKSCLLQINL